MVVLCQQAWPMVMLALSWGAVEGAGEGKHQIPDHVKRARSGQGQGNLGPMCEFPVILFSGTSVHYF